MTNNNNLISQQMYGLGITMQNQLLNSIKIFKSNGSNIIFQYFVLKLINGLDLGIIYNKIKGFLMLLYYQYFRKLLSNYKANVIIFKVTNNPATLSGRSNSNFGYKSDQITTYEDAYEDLWVFNDTNKSLLWYINNKLNELNHDIKGFKFTNSKYINEESVDKNDFRRLVFIPDNIIGVQIDKSIYIDILPQSDNSLVMSHYSNKQLTTDSKVIRVYSWKKSASELREYCNDVLRKYLEEMKNVALNKQKIIIRKNVIENDNIEQTYDDSRRRNKKNEPDPENDKWLVEDFRTNKTWDSLYIENKNDIRTNLNGAINDCQEFVHKHGLPNHLTILAHGKAGCGKNSFCKVLMAEEFSDKHLIVIQPGSIKTYEDWEKIAFSKTIAGIEIPQNKRVYQFDEIDKTIPEIQKIDEEMLREKVRNQLPKEKLADESFNFEAHFQGQLELEVNKRKLNLSKWLNYLDGPYEEEERIIFMTANDIDKLDDLFIRDGRITMTFEFNKATANIVENMIVDIFEYDGNDDEINDLFTQIDDYKHSQAHIIKISRMHIKNYRIYKNNYDYIKSVLNKLIEEQKFLSSDAKIDLSNKPLLIKEVKTKRFKRSSSQPKFEPFTLKTKEN